jgi:ribosomal protein RSM22 (predicted rRNA methylase)
MQVSDALRSALARELTSIPQKQLAAATQQLSLRYRGGDSAFSTYSTADVAAYAAYRMPATFAAVSAALYAVQQRVPQWQPRGLLDVGAGPGTSMWAASELWPSIQHSTLLERESDMIAFGKRLAAQAEAQSIRQAEWRRIDLSNDWQAAPYDLVIASYVLGELPIARYASCIEHLWSLTTGILVIIEPGTPPGYERILRARAQLIAAQADVIAPCPGNIACPMAGQDWCHFARRVARTQLHRQAKQASLSYEDEKFSYVACSRVPCLPISGRVVRHPQVRSGHIYLELCTPEGLQHAIVTRKDKQAFKHARDLRWGDAL